MLTQPFAVQTTEMSNYSYFDTIRTYYFNLALYSRYVLIKYSNRTARSLRQALTDDARKKNVQIWKDLHYVYFFFFFSPAFWF